MKRFLSGKESTNLWQCVVHFLNAMETLTFDPEAGIWSFRRALKPGDELHVVYLDPSVRSIPVSTLQTMLGTIYRQQVIGWARVVDDGFEDAVHHNCRACGCILPRELPGGAT